MPWWQCMASWADGAACRSGWRIQCIAAGAAVRASASGPKAGTSMTSNRNPAVQRCMVFAPFVPTAGTKSCPHVTDVAQHTSTRCHLPVSRKAVGSGSCGQSSVRAEYWQLGAGY